MNLNINLKVEYVSQIEWVITIQNILYKFVKKYLLSIISEKVEIQKNIMQTKKIYVLGILMSVLLKMVNI